MSPDGAIFAVISTLKVQQVCPIQPWSAVLLKPPRECSLNTWLWWLGSWGYIYEPQGSDMKRQALVGYNLQALQRQQSEIHPQSSCEKRPILLSLGFRFATHLGATLCSHWMLLLNIDKGIPSFHSPLALLHLPEKSSYTWMEPHFFSPVDTSRSCGLEASRVVYYDDTTGYIYICMFKSFCLKVWLLISLNLSTVIPPSATQRSFGTPSSTGTSQE